MVASVASDRDEETDSPSASNSDLRGLIHTTGHTASACADGLVAVIGGWRPSCPLTHLHVFVVHVASRTMRAPSLAPGSARPARRMRHAAAVVATPSWASLPARAPEGLPSVLVLGGACDGGTAEVDVADTQAAGQQADQERGTPVAGGLFRLTLLSFCAADGSEVLWREADATGRAPAAIWHHQAASFGGGKVSGDAGAVYARA